ncbi:MAG: hypothetical protein LBB13_00760 [Rickettsiales bacterium]|nr:hypothetical protein [Rickettsiales bacterium]
MDRSGGQQLALLCYEKPGETCHHRIVVERLRQSLSISVEENAVKGGQLSLI